MKSQLFGRALDLCNGNPDDEITSVQSVGLITADIYKRVAPSVVSDVYHNSNSLLNVRWVPIDSFLDYEWRLSAQVTKLAGHGETFKLHDTLLAFMLLSNAGIEDALRVPILSNIGHSRSFDRSLSSDQIIEDTMYKHNASIIRQREKDDLSSNDSSDRLLSYSSSSVRNVGGNGRQKYSER